MALPAFLARSSSGCPDGVPEHGYIRLCALLGSQLIDDQVTLVTDELAFSSAPESNGRSRRRSAP
jgi:hypothetical protein